MYDCEMGVVVRTKGHDRRRSVNIFQKLQYRRGCHMQYFLRNFPKTNYVNF